jgi:hypothetical protein
VGKKRRKFLGGPKVIWEEWKEKKGEFGSLCYDYVKEELDYEDLLSEVWLILYPDSKSDTPYDGFCRDFVEENLAPVIARAYAKLLKELASKTI